MKKTINKLPWIIITSFLVAVLLEIVPLPQFIHWLRPCWVALVLIYWVLNAAEYISIGWAFILGLLLDALTGTFLGVHALGMVLVAYFMAKFQFRIRLFGVWQQALVIFVVLLCYQLLLILIQGVITPINITWLYFLSSVTSALLWPWIYSLLCPD